MAMSSMAIAPGRSCLFASSRTGMPRSSSCSLTASNASFA
eukprot:CAMPEP_0119541908 /NCGR_PEP_ID=MMETSP1344-20130328/53256_1 /TAXON_ID=236787 /ORGANISM="Florenciella parvula, Strain CCMP2471" /LENGTH=39 /DNA_ID= /DNA_START= /DNA_END= /DNA_ORIENTATION=